MERSQRQVNFEQFVEQITQEVCRQQITEQVPCQQAQEPCQQIEQVREQEPCGQTQQIEEQEPCQQQSQQVQELKPCEQAQQVQQVQEVQKQEPCDQQSQQVQEQESCEPAQQIQEQELCEPAQQVQEQEPCESVQQVQKQESCEPAQQIQEQEPCKPVQQVQEQEPCEPAQQVQEQESCEPAQQIQEQEPCKEVHENQESCKEPVKQEAEPCKEPEKAPVKQESYKEPEKAPVKQGPCKEPVKQEAEPYKEPVKQTVKPCKEPEKAPVKQEPCKEPVKQEAEPCKEPELAPMKQESCKRNIKHEVEPCKKVETAPVAEQVSCKQEQTGSVKHEKGKGRAQMAEKIVESPFEKSSYIPTIFPIHPFNARADAEVLYKAMKGLGTNEKVLIDVLCHRTCDQRVQIVQAFKQVYGKDLIPLIKKETTGHLERVLVALCHSRADFLASEIDCAFKSPKSDEVTVAEILCSQSHEDIMAVKSSYYQMFGRPLEVDIEKRVTGGLQMLLLSLLKMKKSDKLVVNYDVNPELVSIVHCAEKRAAYLANRLHGAMKGLGTRDRILIRVIVSRSDVDLGNIKIAYENIYGRSLASHVASEVSFNYKKILLTLID